jgi:hypothetical protein
MSVIQLAFLLHQPPWVIEQATPEEWCEMVAYLRIRSKENPQ